MTVLRRCTNGEFINAGMAISLKKNPAKSGHCFEFEGLSV